MQPSLTKLHKFFKLEAERGYDNKAVVGGLHKIVPAWEAEARVEQLPEDIIQLVIRTLNEYHELNSESRTALLRSTWHEIQTHVHTGVKIDLPSPKHETEQGLKSKEGNQGKASPAQTIGITEETQEIHRPPSQALRRLARRATGGSSDSKLGFDAPLTVITGIGPKHAQILHSLGLDTLGDLLYYFPRRYDDYSQLEPIIRLWYGQEVTVIATVQTINSRSLRAGQGQIIEAVVSDGSGSLRVTWFNQPWLTNRIHPGSQVVLSGKIDQYLGRLVMTSPEWEPLDQEHLNTNRIVPVYPLTANVTQRWLRRIMHQTVTYWAPRVDDYLPPSVKQSGNLINLSKALAEVHFPTSQETLRAARQRLAFDEIFLLQLGVLKQKRSWKEASAQVFSAEEPWWETQLARLPFQLTSAQQRALQDVKRDLISGNPMNRLLQGDVGSGKTVVAALSAAMTVRGGAQAAVMAPTSILAEQHYRSLKELLCARENAPMQEDEISLLIGDTPETEKRQIRERLANGELRLVVGTHALIEAPVSFQNLQLVVVDEQHRFGVEQRASLRSKGNTPHLLVMTATPIPRSLALTIYGDLDLTVMDEMPAGRQVIETHVLAPRERERAYALIRSQVDLGHQAFIIYPLVEQGEQDEVKAAVDEHARLQREVFPRYSVGLVHGRLKPDEKEAVMARFRDNQDHILVSTSVVEVGVDIPNATVMLIEGADHFGLSQLHQFRGRVGRGEAKSYCLLIPDKDDAVENERLIAMVDTNDGFVLAEKDLQQRGPGEFFGTRQSGYGDMHLINLADVRMIEKAREQAQVLFQIDPYLENQEHQTLAITLERFWGDGRGDRS